MFTINPQEIPEGLDASVFQEVMNRMLVLVIGKISPVAPAPAVTPKGPAATLRGKLDTGQMDDVISPATRDCLLAGLWLLEGDLDKAHTLCQSVDTAFGAAWHAIVHRQEGDFWNSKYWWRQAHGAKFDRFSTALLQIIQAAPPALAELLLPLAARYQPMSLVDWVERWQQQDDTRPVLLELQRWEWMVMFAETYRCGRWSKGSTRQVGNAGI